jgi:hypothetical protein
MATIGKQSRRALSYLVTVCFFAPMAAHSQQRLGGDTGWALVLIGGIIALFAARHRWLQSQDTQWRCPFCRQPPVRVDRNRMARWLWAAAGATVAQDKFYRDRAQPGSAPLGSNDPAFREAYARERASLDHEAGNAGPTA